MRRPHYEDLPLRVRRRNRTIVAVAMLLIAPPLGLYSIGHGDAPRGWGLLVGAALILIGLVWKAITAWKRPSG
jgi:hypothetical protein